MKRFFRPAALLALIIACCAPGCRERAGDPTGESGSNSPQDRAAHEELSPAGAALTVTDRLDRRVRFHAAPTRILSLTPSITEVLFAIGAGDRIVGATRYCNYPPEAEDLPRVGGGTLESLSQEKMIALEPDLVLCKWDKHGPLLSNLERIGVPVLALGPESLAELYAETLMLGQITGTSRQAEALVRSMQQRVAAVTRRIPPADGPKVFYQVWDDPLMTAGPHSFIGELLELAGGRNLFQEISIRYPKVSPEVVVAGDPDVILAPSTHATPVTLESILRRPGWTQVHAIREKRVYLIDGDSVSRCGPRLVEALEEIAAVLYPERFAQRFRNAAANDAATKDRVQ